MTTDQTPADRELTPKVAWDRPETDPCQAGTVGCCIDHEGPGQNCETW